MLKKERLAISLSELKILIENTSDKDRKTELEEEHYKLFNTMEMVNFHFNRIVENLTFLTRDIDYNSAKFNFFFKEKEESSIIRAEESSFLFLQSSEVQAYYLNFNTKSKDILRKITLKVKEFFDNEDTDKYQSENLDKRKKYVGELISLGNELKEKGV